MNHYTELQNAHVAWEQAYTAHQLAKELYQSGACGTFEWNRTRDNLDATWTKLESIKGRVR
tara:strand:- start:290 stop:472 length:183 start_codon:yes stop_codon:yes gene_type:complete